MDRDSVERLRYDRRLARRRDWVEDADMEKHLETLPDVSSKMTTVAELEAETSKGEGASAESAPARPASTSESFGGSTSFGGGGFGGAGSA